MFLAVLSGTAVFVAIYFATTVLLPALVAPVLIVSVAALLLLVLILIGSPDEAVVTWHKEQLLSTRELYTTLYNQSPVPYITLDSKGKIAMANQAAARLFQAQTDTLIGLDLLEQFDNELKGDVYALTVAKIRANTPVVDAEMLLQTQAGEERYVSMSVFTNETYNQKLVSLVDITHHKVVDKAKSEFVALATHQLRTPVAAIRWNVELLERSIATSMTSKQSDYLNKVSRNVARMVSLINDFLSVSKLETGTFATTPEPIELASYLPTITEEFEQTIKEKQIELVTNYDPAPFTYVADSRLFHIITSNLLSNAVKYVRPGGQIAFTYEVSATALILTVADSGIGIPKEQLPRLFSKFFRASNAMQHRAEGTGLGLYIVAESVKQLGGYISVESVEDQGTTFTVHLPLPK